MEQTIVTGRIGKDSTVKKVNDRYVYNFTLAVNIGYGEHKQTKWYECSLWSKSDKLSFNKGTNLLIKGSVGARAYLNKENVAVGVLTINVFDFEYLSSKLEDDLGKTAIDVKEQFKEDIKIQEEYKMPEQGGLPF